MAASAVQDAKDITGCTQLGHCSEGFVAKYVRIICAVAFQRISDMISDCWAFSIAVDGSCCQSTSYIDIRVRLCVLGKLRNYHLIAVPFSGSHTGAAMFEVLECVLNALCVSWKSKLIACSTGGAVNMTGRVSGLVTRLGAVALPGFVRIWCAVHQVDLVMQRLYRNVDEGGFYHSLTGLICHLRRQKSLIDRLKSTCPALSGTRWISMSRVSSYLLIHRSEIFNHLGSLDTERRTSQPTSLFWIYLAAVNVIASDVSETVQRLQGKQSLLQQQSLEIEDCINRISNLAFAENASDEEADSGSDEIIYKQGLRFAKEDLHGFLCDQGLFVVQLLRQLESSETDKILHNVAYMLSSLIVGLREVCAERSDLNAGNPSENLPAMPMEFVEMRPRDLIALIESQHRRLSASFAPGEIENICSQHRDLKSRCDKQARFKSAVVRSAGSMTTTFDEAWAIENMASEYPQLCTFAGGLASIFPNTATVESDFSSLF